MRPNKAIINKRSKAVISTVVNCVTAISFTSMAEATENSSFLTQLVSWNELDSQRTVTKRLDSLLREAFGEHDENGGETFDSPMEPSNENEEKEGVPTQGAPNHVGTALVNTENAFEKIARIRGEYYDLNSQYIRLFKFIENREQLERILMRRRISARLDQDPEKNQALRRIEEGISPRLKPMAATYMGSFHNEHITKTNSKMKSWDEEEEQLKQDQGSTVEDRIRIIAKKCGLKFSTETALEFTEKQLALMSWRERILDMELEKAYKQLSYEFGQGTGRFVSETICEFEWVARIPIDDESDRAAVVSRMKQLVEMKKEVHPLAKGRLRQFFEVVDQCASLLLEHDRTHVCIQKRIDEMRLGQSNAFTIPFKTKPKAEGLEKYSEAEEEAFENTQSHLLQNMQKRRLELIQIAARQDQIEKVIILSMIKDDRGQFIECLLEWKSYDIRLQAALSFFDSIANILMPKPEPALLKRRTSLQQSWYETMPSGNEGWLKFFTPNSEDALNLRSSIVLLAKGFGQFAVLIQAGTEPYGWQDWFILRPQSWLPIFRAKYELICSFTNQDVKFMKRIEGKSLPLLDEESFTCSGNLSQSSHLVLSRYADAYNRINQHILDRLLN